MNYSEMLAAVVDINNRPDRTEVAERYIQRATQMLHNVAKFPRDLEVVKVTFATENQFQQIALDTFLPRCKSISFVRAFSGTSPATDADGMLGKMAPDCVFDEFQTQAVDVWHLAGSALNLYCSKALTYAIVGYYKYPIIFPVANYSSWIADVMPYAIIDQAAMASMKAFGDVEGMQQLQKIAEDSKNLLIDTFSVTDGE